MKNFRIALVGNPNCGKSSLFNILTGAKQHVGNYSGVTVDSKSGFFRLDDGEEVEIIDLPGVYSLNSGSPEEKVAFHELTSGKIDCILNVIDSGNAQRNLYLSTQLAELEIPLLLCFNMFDEAQKRGLEIDLKKFESFLGAPVCSSIGTAPSGTVALKKMIAGAARNPAPRLPIKPMYGPRTEDAIEELSAMLEKIRFADLDRIPARCIALKLLEKDPSFLERPELAPLLPEADKWREIIARRNGIGSETLMADIRYGVIAGACREAIRLSADRRRLISDKIDGILTNRIWGLPIFLGVMYLLFNFTFLLGQAPMAWLESLFSMLGEGINSVWPAGSGEYLRKLIVEGIIGGVGGVLVFLPCIVLLFAAIAFLEGSGYMSRAAFVTDGFMHLFGLHGKSFIPMLLGFGCSVPAVLCTRTIESERDRLTTMLVLPFMSCGARLPIYALFIPAFFPLKYQGLMMFIIYLTGTAVALIAARVLKATLFSGDSEVFVMELPPYRMPTLRSILIQMWERTVMYLKKAGTLILGASVLMFILNTWQVRAPEPGKTPTRSEQLENSLAGQIGKGISVVMKPVGFDWRTSSALIGAAAGKELFVAQLGVLFSISDNADASDNFAEKLRSTYTPLQAFCIMLFCLLSMPCLATVAVVARESGSWKWAAFQILMFTVTAWTLTFVVYQIGRFFCR